MDFEKANWQTSADQVKLHLPIAKVNKENRTVSGYATLDNLDQHGDVVLAEASTKAFSRFRGNIREMHDKHKAVGKMIDLREDDFVDADGKAYRGMYVTVRVSKGAQDTWEKVLDGTLNGFSIGGDIIESDTEWVKDNNANVRFIKDYSLNELSLVDSPANQLANVVSFQKSANGLLVKGMVADVRSKNVFWCADDEIYKNSSEEALTCNMCEGAMENVGWYEYDSEAESTEKMQGIVQQHVETKQEDSPENEGGVNDVAHENKSEKDGEVVKPNQTEDAEKEVEAANVDEADDKTEKAADVSEETVDVPDFEKMVGDLKTVLEDGLKANQDQTTEALDSVRKAVDEINAELETKVGDLVKKHDEIVERFAAIEEKTSDTEKRLDSVEKSSAQKKSGELGRSTDDEEESTTKSIWGGRFLKA